MSIKQLSVFLSNKPGTLSDVCSVFSENKINMHALSLADTQDFGILRVIVENPENAAEILKKAGFTCKLTEVVAIMLEDKPGGMAKVMEAITKADVSVEYAYAFLSGKPGSAYMIFRVSGDEPIKKLSTLGLPIVDEKELF